MAEGHGWGGASSKDSNHPALASASAAPPYPKRGALSRAYVAVYIAQPTNAKTTPWELGA